MAGTEKQREEINRKLVTMQMELIGKTYQDAMDTPEFWRVYTLTTEQTETWRKDAIKLIQKTFKCNRKKALLTMNMFELQLGLRIYDGPIMTTCYDTSSIPEFRTTIPPEAYILKDQQPTFWQKVKKFFIGFY